MEVWFPFWWLIGCAAVCLIGWDRLGPARSGWSVFGIALILRVVPAMVATIPPQAMMHFDIDSMQIVGGLVRHGQDVYAATARYPYLPLQMYLFALTSWMSQLSGLPFEMLLKLPLALADSLLCVLVWSWKHEPEVAGTPSAGLIYAFNPVSIAVACVHGQFDSGVILLLMAAMLLVRRGTTAAGAGAVFGVSVLVKPWPVILLPVALIQLPTGRQRLHFAAGMTVVCLSAIVMYCGIFAVSPSTLLAPVGGYSSLVGGWGLPLVTSLIAGGGVGTLAAGYGIRRDLVLLLGKIALVVIVFAAGAKLRRVPIERACTLVILVFYVFTYGWGFHYLAWVVPFLLVSTTGRAARLYIAAATASLLVVMYGMGGVALLLPGWPLLVTYPSAVSVLMWGVCVAVLLLLTLAWRLPEASFRGAAELQGRPLY